jgi:hypothetical protein
VVFELAHAWANALAESRAAAGISAPQCWDARSGTKRRSWSSPARALVLFLAAVGLYSTRTRYGSRRS